MGSMQQQTLETLAATSRSLSEHISASSKRLEFVSADREARVAQLSLLQQDLHYIFEALTRMQRICDSPTAEVTKPAATTSTDT